MHIKVTSDTLFKTQPKLSNQLSDSEQVFVANGSRFDIEYYVDVGDYHWQVELLEPSLGDQTRKSWYVFRPDIELSSDVRLEVTSDTLFKTSPRLSSELADNQKLFVKNKTRLMLVSHLPSSGNHTQVTLTKSLGPEDRTVWFAYTPDIRILGERQELKVVSDTLFKVEPRLSSELDRDQKTFVKGGSTFQLNSYSDVNRNHIRVALEGAFLGSRNLTTWHAYTPDIQINGNIPGNQPNDTNVANTQPAHPRDPGIPLKFPGFGGTYFTNHPIIWTTRYNRRGNFTWGEATHGGTRIPESKEVVYGIVRIAKALEDIRHRLGNRPITITSWYRPPAINRAVRGASSSRHLKGDGVDFRVAGYHPYEVYARLDNWWGARGGLASSNAFTHIDARGSKARWAY